MYHSETVKYSIECSLKVIRTFDWLLDLYVLDYFVDSHWSKLPQSWQDNFFNMDPKHLGNILSGKPTNHILPLSVLALVKTVNVLSIPRQRSIQNISPQSPQNKNKENDNILLNKLTSVSDHISPNKKNNIHLDCPAITESQKYKDAIGNNPKLKNLFLKHVKLKKRHEISVMAELVHNVAMACECNAVIDFGSGLGHLVRMLTYKYNLNAAGIECQSQLTEEARKLDKELVYTASKHLSSECISKFNDPHHFNITLSSHNQLANLSLPHSMSTYGLIGLHPCGDLGPLLINYFVNYPQVKFICVVGCCFMKLTCGPNSGYPMSDYVAKLESHLSYPSREIACHAIEVYCDRLRKGNYENLKVHAYRAALERLLVEYNPKLKHAKVRSIKHSDTMTFERYCTLALERLNIPLPNSAETWLRGNKDIEQWRRIVIVYTLRLTLAPLVETVILLDRLLYLLENGLSCEIHPVFDPALSPRNHVIIARR